MIQIKSHNQGIALLLTLITVSAIITITLSMVGLTLQQLQLSVDARDSERVFHAASAGLECAQFVRNRQTDAFTEYTSGPGPVLNCMEETNPYYLLPATINEDNGTITTFRYQIEPTFNERPTCIQMDINIMKAADNLDMDYDFGGQVGEVDCRQSSVCTVVNSRGYNRACGPASTGNYEILRELNAIF